MVRKVKCSDCLGLNERNVDDCDVNINGGAESDELFCDSVILRGFRGPNSSRMRASCLPLGELRMSEDPVRFRTSSSWRWITLMNASRRSSVSNSKKSSSWPFTMITRPWCPNRKDFCFSVERMSFRGRIICGSVRIKEATFGGQEAYPRLRRQGSTRLEAEVVIRHVETAVYRQ